MSTGVRWSTPSVLANGFRGTDERDDHGADTLHEGGDERHENGSEHSYASSSEHSTNATQSDLAGAGRTVGRLYSRAGRVLETGLAKVVKRAHSTRRQNAEQQSTDHGQSLELQVIHENEQDGQGQQRRQRRGTSTTTTSTSRTGSSIRRAFTFATATSDETATNLPGAGRLIGNIYTAGGRLLESRLNKMAVNSGRGPDACAERIRKAVIGEPYADEELLYLNVKVQGKWKTKDLLLHERVLFTECKQLLRYASSSLRSTHNRALQVISELVTEDRFVRTLFNYLGASRILEGVRKRELRIHNIDSDWFIPYCRKAIVCLSDNEVNTTLFRHLRMAEHMHDLPLPLIYYTLEKYLNDPELSFLAVRYLRRMIKRWWLLSFPFDIASDCLARLAGLAYSLPHIVEWDCMDDIFRVSLKSCLSHIDEHGQITAYNLAKWIKVLVSSLTQPHRLPQTTEYLSEMSDVKSLLDPTNPHNIWSTTRASTNTVILPSGEGFRREYIRAVASLPKLLLATQSVSSALQPDTISSSEPPLMVSTYDNYRAFCNQYHHDELERIRANLSIGPDVVTSEIVSLRDTDWHSPRGRVDGVAKDLALSFLCDKLVGFLSRPDPEIMARAIQWIRLILQFDRYCRQALIRSLHKILSESDYPLRDRGPQSFTVPDLPNISSLEEIVPRRWMYRHRNAEGELHVRSNPPYSTKDPCLICVEKGVWEFALVSDPCDVFCGSQQLILALEVGPGERFKSSGHIPILAGINGAHEKEFIAAAMYVDEARTGLTNIAFHAFTTVKEEAESVEYLDEKGLHTTDRFWVFVLRYDTEDAVEQKLLDKGYFDVTGHCYWMPDRQTTFAFTR